MSQRVGLRPRMVVGEGYVWELDFDEITSAGVEPCAWHNGLFVVSCENVFLAACDENGYCN